MSATLMPIVAESWCTAQNAMCKPLGFTFIRTGYMNTKGPLTFSCTCKSQALVTHYYFRKGMSCSKLFRQDVRDHELGFLCTCQMQHEVFCMIAEPAAYKRKNLQYMPWDVQGVCRTTSRDVMQSILLNFCKSPLSCRHCTKFQIYCWVRGCSDPLRMPEANLEYAL